MGDREKDIEGRLNNLEERFKGLENRERQGGVGAKEEYQSLRAELLQWQNVRFVLIGTSSAAVTAVLGFTLRDPSQQQWPVISSLLLLFLFFALLLTWYAGAGNAKMGSYLAAFYEAKREGWEGRLAEINDRSEKWIDRFNLNHIIASLYFVLGIASFLPFFWYSWYNENTALWSLATLGPSLLFLVFVWLSIIVIFRSYLRSDYQKLWQEIKAEEEQENVEEDNKRSVQQALDKERDKREQAEKEVRRLREELKTERSKGFWQRMFGG